MTKCSRSDEQIRSRGAHVMALQSKNRILPHTPRKKESILFSLASSNLRATRQLSPRFDSRSIKIVSPANTATLHLEIETRCSKLCYCRCSTMLGRHAGSTSPWSIIIIIIPSAVVEINKIPRTVGISSATFEFIGQFKGH